MDARTPTLSREPTIASVKEEVESCRSLLGMFARVLYAPLKQEEVGALSAANFASASDGDTDDGERMLCEGLSRMATFLDSAVDDKRLALNVDYTSSLYGINEAAGVRATPYESMFTGKDRQLYGSARFEVFEAFKKDALKVQPGIDLPEDHLSFELQYIAFLCASAISNLDANDVSSACASLSKAADFASCHVANWIADLYEATVKLVKYDFYPGVVEAAEGLVLIMIERFPQMVEALHGKQTA